MLILNYPVIAGEWGELREEELWKFQFNNDNPVLSNFLQESEVLVCG